MQSETMATTSSMHSISCAPMDAFVQKGFEEVNGQACEETVINE